MEHERDLKEEGLGGDILSCLGACSPRTTLGSLRRSDVPLEHGSCTGEHAKADLVPLVYCSMLTQLLLWCGIYSRSEPNCKYYQMKLRNKKENEKEKEKTKERKNIEVKKKYCIEAHTSSP